ARSRALSRLFRQSCVWLSATVTLAVPGPSAKAQCTPEWTEDFPDGQPDGAIYSLFEFGSGAGKSLYAAGLFQNAGGLSCRLVGRWDGRAWSSVGSGLDGTSVLDFTAFDDGRGRALYAAGDLLVPGQSSTGVARWDGENWTGLATGITGTVYAL